jgi:hypothetical protein
MYEYRYHAWDSMGSSKFRVALHPPCVTPLYLKLYLAGAGEDSLSHSKGKVITNPQLKTDIRVKQKHIARMNPEPMGLQSSQMNTTILVPDLDQWHWQIADKRLAVHCVLSSKDC